MLDQHRHDDVLEAVEMRIEHVQRHLDGIEGEVVAEPDLEHVLVDMRALMAGEADEADFSSLLGL